MKQSPHNWIGFHPLYTLNNQRPFLHCSPWLLDFLTNQMNRVATGHRWLAKNPQAKTSLLKDFCASDLFSVPRYNLCSFRNGYMHIFSKGFYVYTFPKTNIAPGSRPSQKETHLPTRVLSGAILASGSINIVSLSSSHVEFANEFPYIKQFPEFYPIGSIPLKAKKLTGTTIFSR